MKKIYMLVLLAVSIVVTTAITGCNNQTKVEDRDLPETIEKDSDEIIEPKKETRELEEERENSDEDTDGLILDKEDDKVTADSKEDIEVFKIYGANMDTYEAEVVGEIDVETSLTLKEKLNKVAEELSKSQFQGLVIEVNNIEEEDGRKIAVINLVESEGDTRWYNYFQGSTGGAVTSVSLEETFLQRDYEGEWIDGVKFLYDGDNIMFDHVETLGEINYR